MPEKGKSELIGYPQDKDTITRDFMEKEGRQRGGIGTESIKIETKKGEARRDSSDEKERNVKSTGGNSTRGSFGRDPESTGGRDARVIDDKKRLRW